MVSLHYSFIHSFISVNASCQTQLYKYRIKYAEIEIYEMKVAAK